MKQADFPSSQLAGGTAKLGEMAEIWGSDSRAAIETWANSTFFAEEPDSNGKSIL